MLTSLGDAGDDREAVVPKYLIKFKPGSVKGVITSSSICSMDQSQ